jgi:beta-galactosidase
LIFTGLLIFAFALSAQTNTSNYFDNGWTFHLGAAQGAEQSSFDDAKWRQLTIPHNWSSEDLPGKNSPFISTAISQVNEGFWRHFLVS